MKRAFYWIDGVIFLGLAAVLFPRQSWGMRSIAGFILALGGFVLWTTARLQLGESFRARPHAHRLVTRGLYGWFRHPVYLFAGLAFLGLAVAWGRWFGFAGLVLLWILQLWRVRREDAVLREAFGEEYRRYRTGTWF